MSAFDATVRLRASLEDVAAALSAPDAEALLGTEAGLAAALADVQAYLHAPIADRGELRDELLKATGALARCRVLGASLSDAAQLALTAQGQGASYGRSGGRSPAAADPRGHRLRTRL
jgi:hypothetical protein